MNVIRIVCLLMFLSYCGHIAAQGGENKEERLEAQKVSFFTTKLDLSQSEAKVFWPIYEEYQEEQQSIRAQQRTLRQKVNSVDKVSEEEAKQIVAEILNLEEREIKLKRHYVDQLDPAIGYKKIAVLFSLEQQFREKVLRSLKRRMRDRRQ